MSHPCFAEAVSEPVLSWAMSSTPATTSLQNEVRALGGLARACLSSHNDLKNTENIPAATDYRSSPPDLIQKMVTVYKRNDFHTPKVCTSPLI